MAVPTKRIKIAVEDQARSRSLALPIDSPETKKTDEASADDKKLVIARGGDGGDPVPVGPRFQSLNNDHAYFKIAIRGGNYTLRTHGVALEAVGYTKDSSKITKTVLMEMILAKGGGQSEEDQARWVYDMLFRSGMRVKGIE